MIPLSDDDLKHIAPLLRRFSTRAQHTITLPGLIERWNKFVAGVETGYDRTGYDYVDDLAVRDLLEEVLQVAPEGLGDLLRREVIAPLDARFRAVTRELLKPIGFAPPEATEWWWRRAPLDLSGELASDVLARDH